ncbi:MAG: sugar nucleotide-binding protein [Planctomycetes bacterium]|nr:sugar nucleotide-binding protein [Planctomycetota bacterium]
MPNSRHRSDLILLTGMSGVFGVGLARSLGMATAPDPLREISPDGPPLGKLVILGRQHPAAWRGVEFATCDLMQPGILGRLIEKYRPHAVLHAAATARPADCEQHPAAAWRINAESTADAAWVAQKSGTRMVFLSTDQVFDGTATSYAENAERCPLQVYGKTKAAAEDEVLAAGGIVVRLPLLLGAEGAPGHMGADQALLEASLRGESIGLFHDEVRAPADAALLAAPIWRLLGPKPLPLKAQKGRIYHLAGAEAVSRYQMGERVCAAAGINFQHGRMSVAEWQGVPRPPRLVLTCARAERELNFQPPDLRQSLARVETLRSAGKF